MKFVAGKEKPSATSQAAASFYPSTPHIQMVVCEDGVGVYAI
jgi:hypothetical protein